MKERKKHQDRGKNYTRMLRLQMLQPSSLQVVRWNDECTDEKNLWYVNKTQTEMMKWVVQIMNVREWDYLSDFYIWWTRKGPRGTRIIRLRIADWVPVEGDDGVFFFLFFLKIEFESMAGVVFGWKSRWFDFFSRDVRVIDFGSIFQHERVGGLDWIA